MTITITLTSECLQKLDLSSVQTIINPLLQAQDHQGAYTSLEQQISFNIEYVRDPEDPRELSEIPEVRLWFIRLDASYPWFPLLLDWKSGELARYAAMLVPHQFNRKEGIQYNPEALEIFVMQKIFVLMDWMNSQGIESNSRINSMIQMFGYELDDAFFEQLSINN